MPTINDDVTVQDRFILSGGSTQNINSMIVNGGGSFISAGVINVTTDVTLNSGLEVQGGGRFTWGGQGTIGDGSGGDTLSLVYGSNNNKIVGNHLNVASTGVIQYRWFEVPTGTPGNTTPLIDLSGDLIVNSGSTIRIRLDGALASQVIPLGSYLLIDGASITGPLPTLSLQNFNAAQAGGTFWLEEFNNGIYLTSTTFIPTPAALPAGALLIGAIALRRHRR